MSIFYIVVILLLSSAALGYPDTSRQSECPRRPTTGTILLPHRDCRKFYICDHGQKVEMKCKNGLHFNPEYQICDYPQSAGCIKSLYQGDRGSYKKLRCYWA